jgi:hypothetical protein
VTYESCTEVTLTTDYAAEGDAKLIAIRRVLRRTHAVILNFRSFHVPHISALTRFVLCLAAATRN